MKKRFLLFLTMIPIVTNVFAIKEEVDGIWYEISKENKTAAVTNGEYFDYYTQNIEIPPTIVYNEETYDVTAISRGAFAFSRNITAVTIPNSVTVIDEEAFANCTNLATISIPNSVKAIGREAFSGCTSLETVSISNEVTIIDTCTFQHCSKLSSITIPDSVKHIRPNAFDGCVGILTIIIPKDIKSIGREAFSGCKQLTDVYCHAEIVPETEMDIFSYSNIQYATLHVPSASKGLYSAEYPWGTFRSIVDIDDVEPDLPTGEACATPTISYQNGKLVFSCSTENVVFNSSITSADFNSYSTNEVMLCATYDISVFATKPGYRDSEKVIGKLCWIDMEPKTEGINNSIANVRAYPVLIQSHGNTLSITGAEEGTTISVYDTAGSRIWAGKVAKGRTIINTPLDSGVVNIVRIGDNVMKVLVK